MSKTYNDESLARNYMKYKSTIKSFIAKGLLARGQPLTFVEDATSDFFFYLQRIGRKNPPRKGFYNWMRLRLSNFLSGYMSESLRSGSVSVDEIPAPYHKCSSPEFSWPNGLRKEHRILLTLRYMADLTIKEISDKLKLTSKQVRSRLKYARRRFRELSQ